MSIIAARCLRLVLDYAATVHVGKGKLQHKNTAAPSPARRLMALSQSGILVLPYPFAALFSTGPSSLLDM